MVVRPGIDVERELRADDPVLALREAVWHELNQGVSRDEVIAKLEDEMLRLRKQGRDEEEDVVTDVLDFLYGRSTSWMRV
jgi:hypothetical protein